MQIFVLYAHDFRLLQSVKIRDIYLHERLMRSRPTTRDSKAVNLFQYTAIFLVEG